VRDGGRSASSPPVRVGSFLTSPRWSPVRVGSFVATGEVAFPIGANSLFLSVFSAPSGAFSRAFFLFAFLGFLSSNLRTSSFSFCFADLRGASRSLDSVRMATSRVDGVKAPRDAASARRVFEVVGLLLALLLRG
jgi:hypothetical protein